MKSNHPCHRHGFISTGWHDKENGYIQIPVRNGQGYPCNTSVVTIFENSIRIPPDVMENMEKIPVFDGINEIIRGEILLEYLRKTHQKAKILNVYDYDRLIGGQWKDVFLLES